MQAHAMKWNERESMINFLINKFKQDGIFLFLLKVIRYPVLITLAYPALYKRRKAERKMLAKDNIKDKFDDIYKHKIWFQNKESLSGGGSTVAYTQPLRNWLIDNIPKLGVSSVADLACGDFNWMKFVVPEIDIEYIGLDIVDSVIEKNKDFENTRVSFRQGNICEDVLPSCDLIIVRDCLFHLSYEDI